MIAISSTTEKKSSVKMNEDLARWLNETPEKISGEFDTNLGTNKPKGKCKICGAHKATAVCVKCGKPVCNDHYYHIIGCHFYASVVPARQPLHYALPDKRYLAWHSGLCR